MVQNEIWIHTLKISCVDNQWLSNSSIDRIFADTCRYNNTSNNAFLQAQVKVLIRLEIIDIGATVRKEHHPKQSYILVDHEDGH
jgi:hypothetical protein